MSVFGMSNTCAGLLAASELVIAKVAISMISQDTRNCDFIFCTCIHNVIAIITE